MLTEGVCALSLHVCMFHTCRSTNMEQTNPLKTAKPNNKDPYICTGHGKTSCYSVNKYAMRILYFLSGSIRKESRDDLRYLGGVCK